MSESVPSSVTGFAHRHTRSDSVASFAYFEEDDETPEYLSDEEIVDESDEETDINAQAVGGVESDGLSSPRRQSSGYSRASVEDALLYRHDSTKTDVSAFGRSSRRSQKIYVVTEDLTIVVAGFSTRPLGLAIYILLCTVSFGIAYLLFRWLPHWRVALVGSPISLQDCTWVVVEVS